MLALSACGGESRRVTAGTGGSAGHDARTGNATGATSGADVGQGGAPASTGAASAGNGGVSFGVGAAGIGGAAGAPGDQTESIDGVEPGTVPSLASPAGFYWSGGLGNWFVCTPRGGNPNSPIHGDAQSADIVPPRGESTRAFRLQGSGEPLGADLYAQLEHPDGRAVDLSAYAGIGFWAKLDGDSDQLAVGLSALAPYCSASTDVTTVTVAVRNEWQKFELPFAAFGTDGHAVANIEFIVGAGGGAFDVWIDDLSLVCRGECPTHW
jgi:hypothetical protein